MAKSWRVKGPLHLNRALSSRTTRYALEKEEVILVLQWAKHYKFTFLSREEEELVERLKKFVE